MNAARLLRYLWVSPCTLVGGVVALPALLAGGARARLVDGVIEVSGPPQGARWARRLPFAAITLGHLVLAGTPRAMEELRAHERVHVRQAERWGPAFFAVYLALGAWQWLRGRDAYRDHPFEIQARSLNVGPKLTSFASPEGSVNTLGRPGGVDRLPALTTADCAPAAGSSRSSA
jgi:hypothetical protein